MKKLKKVSILSEKDIKNINKVAVMSALLLVSLSLITYFDPGLYFKDKYDWYNYMADKNQNVLENENALKYVEKALVLGPEGKKANAGKVEIYAAMGRYDEAEDVLALDIFKESCYYYSKMGLSPLTLEKLDYAGNSEMDLAAAMFEDLMGERRFLNPAPFDEVAHSVDIGLGPKGYGSESIVARTAGAPSSTKKSQRLTT